MFQTVVLRRSHHHIRFYIRFTCWHALDGFQKIDFQANLSLARSLLTLPDLCGVNVTKDYSPKRQFFNIFSQITTE